MDCMVHGVAKSQTQLSAFYFRILRWASLVAQLVEKLPAVQETQVQPLGWEDHLEKERASHSDSLAWEIPWTEKPGGLPSLGSQESDTSEQLNHHHLPLPTVCP